MPACAAALALALLVPLAHASFAPELDKTISNDDNANVLRASDVHSFEIDGVEYVAVTSLGTTINQADSDDGLEILRVRATDSGLETTSVASLKHGANDPSGTPYALGNPQHVEPVVIGSETYLLVLNGDPSRLQLLKLTPSGGSLTVSQAASLDNGASGSAGPAAKLFLAIVMDQFELGGQPHVILRDSTNTLQVLKISESDISVVSSAKDGEKDANGVDYRFKPIFAQVSSVFTVDGDDGPETYVAVGDRRFDSDTFRTVPSSIQILRISESGEMSVASTIVQGDQDDAGATFDLNNVKSEITAFKASGKTYIAYGVEGAGLPYLSGGTPITQQAYEALLQQYSTSFFRGVSDERRINNQNSIQLHLGLRSFQDQDNLQGVSDITPKIEVIDVSDPASPLFVGSAALGQSDDANNKFDLIADPLGSALVRMGERQILAQASNKDSMLISTLDYTAHEICVTNVLIDALHPKCNAVNTFPDNQIAGVQFVDVSDPSSLRSAGSVALPLGYDKVDTAQRITTVLDDTFAVVTSLESNSQDPSLNTAPFNDPTSGLAVIKLAGPTQFVSANADPDSVRVSLSNDVSARGGSFDLSAWRLAGESSAGLSVTGVTSVPGSPWQLDLALSRSLAVGDSLGISFTSSPGAAGMPTVLPDQPATSFDLESFSATVTVRELGIASAQVVSPHAVLVTFSEPVRGATSAESWSFGGAAAESVSVPPHSFRAASEHAALFGRDASGSDFLVQVEGSSSTAITTLVARFDLPVRVGGQISFAGGAQSLDGQPTEVNSFETTLRSAYSEFLDTSVISAYVAADSGGAPPTALEQYTAFGGIAVQNRDRGQTGDGPRGTLNPDDPQDRDPDPLDQTPIVNYLPTYLHDSFARLEGARDVAVFETDGQKLAEALYSDEWPSVSFDSETMVATLSGHAELDPRTVNLAGSVGTFAVVASYDDDGLQIVNITDPYAPLPVAAVADGLSVAPGCAGRDPPQYCTQPRTATPEETTLGLSTHCDVVLAQRATRNNPVVVIESENRGVSVDQAIQASMDRCISVLQEQSLAILQAQLDRTPPSGLLAPILDTSTIEYMDGVQAVDLATINGLTFAVAVSYDDGGMEIVGLSDPRNPVKYGGLNGISEANDVSVFSTNDRHYAIITSQYGIENYAGAVVVVDITNPALPVAISKVEDDDMDADERKFEYLAGPSSVATFEAGGVPYAAVTSYDDVGIQVIDLSDPANPKAASSVSPGMRDRDGRVFADFEELSSVETFKSGDAPYAVVSDDFGLLQVVGLADPRAPRSVAVIDIETAGDNGRSFAALEFPRGVDVAEVNGRTLAAVAESLNGGVFLVDLTDPASPENVAYAAHDDYDPAGAQAYVYEPYGVALSVVDGRLYAAVANSEADPARPLTGAGSLALMDLTEAAGLAENVRMVKVGALAPLTGSVSSLGLHWEAAMKASERDLNRFLAESGADWRLSLQIRDSRADPPTALGHIRDFDQRGITAVIGPATSGSVTAAQAYVRDNGMTLLSYGSTAESLALEDGIFRLVPPDTLMGPFLAEQLVNAGMDHVTIAYRDDAWGRGLAESVRDNLNARLPEITGARGTSLVDSVRSGDLRSVALVPYQVPVTDAAAVVSEMASAHKTGDSAVLLLDFSTDAVSIMSAADAASSADGAAPEQAALGTSQWFGTSILDTLISHTAEVRDFASQVKYTSIDAAPDEDHPDYERVTRAVSARLEDGHSEFSIYTYAAYDAVQLLGRAVLAADSASSEALKAGIPSAAKGRAGLVGDNTLDANGDLAAARFTLTQVRDGQGVPIEPYPLPLTVVKFEISSSAAPGLAKAYDTLTVTFETEEDFYYTVQRNGAKTQPVTPEVRAVREANPHQLAGGIDLELSGKAESRLDVDAGSIDLTIPPFASIFAPAPSFEYVELYERAAKSFTGRIEVNPQDPDGPLDIQLHIDIGGATVTLTEEHLTSPNIVVDNTAPQFDSAILTGSRALTLFYTEPVVTAAADYTGFEYGGSSAASADSAHASGSSVMVRLAQSEDAFEGGDLIKFEISGVADRVGNALFNEGTKTLVPVETDRTVFAVRDTDGDGFADIALPPSPLVRQLESSAPLRLDLSQAPDPAAPDDRVQSAEGQTAQLEAPLTVRLSSATVSLPAGLQLGGLGQDQALAFTANPQIALTQEQARTLGVDVEFLIEVGDADARIELSEPARIELESLDADVYVLDRGEVKRVQACPEGVGADSTAAEAAGALESLEAGDGVDEGSCFADNTVWTLHFTAWGTGTEDESGGGDDCDDCTAPTLGIGESGARLVSGGFAYNGRAMDVQHFFTPYPLITAEVGQENVVTVKAYEESGPSNISRVALAFGLRSGEVISESRAVINYDMRHDGTGSVSAIDPNGALDSETLRVSTAEVACSPDSNLRCLSVSFHHTFRAPLEFDIVGTDVWDVERNSWQNYFNHGIRVTGEPMDPAPGLAVNGGTLVLHPLHPGSTNTSVMVDENHDLYRLAPDGLYHPLRNMSALYHAVDESMYLPRDRAANPDRNSPEAREALKAQTDLAQAALESLYGRFTDGDFGAMAEQPPEIKYVERAHDEQLQASIALELEKARALYGLLFANRN